VGLSDLTGKAVLSAIAEFDAIGRDEFLKKYGFGRSRGYFVTYQGRPYDSKAIAGAAHGNVGGLKSLQKARPMFSCSLGRRVRSLATLTAGDPMVFLPIPAKVKKET
jgi:5-methylcytosine-specific restriction protein A